MTDALDSDNMEQSMHTLSKRNYAQTQFSVCEFSVEGQSWDFQCMRTTHYNAYSLKKGHNNVYSQ